MDFLCSTQRLGVESLLMPTKAAAVDWIGLGFQFPRER